ncbi:MAG TPA: hypothetical protein VFT24_10430, partial [Vicinamibacterales bacterium]|nr:hypothetical protein [Vicinamibacterales bacterium]
MRTMSRIVVAGLALGTGVFVASPHAIVGPLDTSRTLPYFIADGRGKTGFRSTDTELARWALDDWQRSSGQAIRFEPAPESSALIRLHWAEPTEGQFGEMETIVVGERLGAALYIRPDMGSL